MTRPFLAAAILFLAAPVRAQFGYGAGLGPDSMGNPSPSKNKKAPRVPLGLALSLVLDATSWFAVGVSTTETGPELERMAAKGYYKLELLQMTLLAQRSGKTLAHLAGQREKGSALRALAEGLQVDFDPLYDASVELGRRVDERLESLKTVSPLPKPAGVKKK